MPSVRDRRRAQAGTTLVELLVAMTIMGLALVLIVGTFSTGLLDATIAKRNTAVEAIVQYEMDNVNASTFDGSAGKYSECFATENPTSPTLASGYRAPCPSGPFALRADMTWVWLPSSNSVQVWTVTVTDVPGGSPIGNAISFYKVNR